MRFEDAISKVIIHKGNNEEEKFDRDMIIMSLLFSNMDPETYIDKNQVQDFPVWE